VLPHGCRWRSCGGECDSQSYGVPLKHSHHRAQPQLSALISRPADGMVELEGCACPDCRRLAAGEWQLPPEALHGKPRHCVVCGGAWSKVWLRQVSRRFHIWCGRFDWDLPIRCVFLSMK
jgi:hypothetical protein